jgi:nitroreductase
MNSSDAALKSALASNPVDEAIVSRHSIRAYSNREVPQSLVSKILAVSARAPSGTNTQPWKVYALNGADKTALCDKVSAAFNDPEVAALSKEAYSYYPAKWTSPYIERRRKVGWDLYSLLGIGKADKTRMHDQHLRNFTFFDAPVGLIFTIDRIMGQGSWLDYGMFLQNIMVAARGYGLDTCPQAAWNSYHEIIRAHLGCGEEEVLVCGMALGYADPSAIENSLITEREPVENFVKFRGF